MTEVPPPIPAEPPSEPAQPGSLWSRMLNVIAAPSEAFQDLLAAPSSAANWVVPALVILVAGWVSAWLIFSQESITHQLSEISDKAIQKQVDAKKLTKEQAEAARAAADKFGSIGVKIGAGITPVMVGFVSPFWWALLLWLVGAKAFKGEFCYMRAVEVAGLSNMISLLEIVIKTLLILVTGSLFAGPNLGMLVKDFDASNTVHGLLATVDVMTFWGLAVKSFGLSKLSGASWGRSAAWVFGLWLLFTGLMVGIGLAFKAAFG